MGKGTDGQAREKRGEGISVRHMPDWKTGPGFLLDSVDGDSEKDVFGAYYNEREAGLIILHYPAADTVEITWFGVHPYLQSKGIGAALFEQARAHAVAKGCRALIAGLPVEAEGDIQSDHRQNFYKSRGFRHLADYRPQDPQRPILWLQLAL